MCKQCGSIEGIVKLTQGRYGKSRIWECKQCHHVEAKVEQFRERPVLRSRWRNGNLA